MADRADRPARGVSAAAPARPPARPTDVRPRTAGHLSRRVGVAARRARGER